jgi:hypothetical protein
VIFRKLARGSADSGAHDPPYGAAMAPSFPIVWVLHGRTYTGGLAFASDRLLLSSRSHALAVPFGFIAQAEIDRHPSTRIRGLPSIAVRLRDSEVLRIASLAGAGSLHELLALVEGAQVPAGSGT